MSDSRKLLFGTEIEYAVSAIDREGHSLPPSTLVRLMLNRAERRPHLRAHEGGIFLENGVRCLIEPGGGSSHFEVASPETCNPFDAVRYELAGDRLVAQLAEEVAASNSFIDRTWLRKGGTDYSAGTTWGAHENYLFSLTPPEKLHPQLVAHCVSRIILAGSGGFDRKRRFVLSPRATFVGRVVDASAIDARALIDTRHQPHCAGHHRLHLMCGDHLRGTLANVLKIGTTALIVALADIGRLDTNALELARPLEALDTINHDETLRHPVALSDGRSASAFDIQQGLLIQVRASLDLFPDWATEVCDLWADVLARLSEGPRSLADRLEWCLKLMLFRDRVTTSYGLPWSADGARGNGQDWCDQISEQQMAQLHETDLRFTQIYPASLFDELVGLPADDGGPGFGRLEEIGGIDRALVEPPEGGRAKIRGIVVQRLANHTPPFTCAWDSIKSRAGRLCLDLSDPFAATETWMYGQSAALNMPAELWDLLSHLELPASSVRPEVVRALAEPFCRSDATDLRRRSARYAADINNRALDLRECDRLDEAEWLLRAALAIDLECATSSKKVPHRRNNLATVLIMKGILDEARDQVTMAWRAVGSQYDLTSARVLTMRLAVAFLAGEGERLFLSQLKEHLKIDRFANYAEVATEWRATSILRSLTKKLDGARIDFLERVIDVLNGKQPRDVLNESRIWLDVQPASLDLRWPGSNDFG